jgi:hypothetical protein
MELAAQLLEVADEEELDQFLGNLVKRATRAAGRALASPTGQALQGLLKNAARQALPLVGGAVGGALGSASTGQQLATNAGRLFGLELEGLSPEDQEYEVARRFVRFAGRAAANAGRMRGAGGAAGARSAAMAAARRHAPGLLRRRGPGGGRPGMSPSTGRWIRQGRNVVIVNCSPPSTAQSTALPEPEPSDTGASG